MDKPLVTPIDWNDPAVVDTYDEVPLWSALFGTMLLRHVPLRPARIALDIGCGTGFPLLELAQRLGPSAHVYGVDPWAAALARAERKATAWGVRNVTLLEADAAAIPLPDSAVDLIVSNLGVNNVGDLAAVLRECRRVARPEARIALTTNLVGHMREFYAVFARVLAAHSSAEALARLEAHIAHRATVAGLQAALHAAGFAVTRVIEDEAQLRFADGSALLAHSFIRLGFLPAWLDVIGPLRQRALLGELETALNELAAREGELLLRVPMAYIEGRASKL
jgi:ubiquinone/menaquinone biosynthesis C-methylase UbiE